MIGITFLVFCLDYLSPNGYRAMAVGSGEGDGDELNFSNSLWFAAGSILQQGADNTPRSGSGRMLAGAFWFFTLILISTYTANLAAYFTGTKQFRSSFRDGLCPRIYPVVVNLFRPDRMQIQSQFNSSATLDCCCSSSQAKILK